MIYLLLMSATAFAIDFLPCQRALQGNVYAAPDGAERVLDDAQVVVKGELVDFWETGMEDQTLWAVMDEQTRTQLSGNGYYALFGLQTGDEVFLVTEAGELIARGFHYETSHLQMHSIFKVPVQPNIPHLLRRPDGSELAIDSDEYRALFERGSRAVVITRMNPDMLRQIDRELAPKLQALTAHLNDPERFIAVGDGQFHERAVSELAFVGKPQVGSAGIVQLAQNGELTDLKVGDLLYLVDEAGHQLSKIEVHSFPVDFNASELGLIARASYAVLIRRTHD